MSINTINNLQSYAISSHKGEELSLTTKMRLEALGIDPSSITSEAQAQILIAQAEAAQHQNNSGHEKRGGQSEQQLMSEAKELAKDVGVHVAQTDTIDDIVGNISEKINAMAKDPAKSQIAQSYHSRLEVITDKANEIKRAQQNIFNAMNIISTSNKLVLGL